MDSLPVGEEKWVDYVEEKTRQATDLEKRVHVVGLFGLAVEAEPNSVKVWRAYCEYFWSLHINCQSGDAGWSEEEQQMGREEFSLNAALSLWQQGYEAIQYRISDSHELWDRWISLERGMLEKTRTPEGVKRITHLYADRLQIPHITWDETSQTFSSFLSTYNKAAWEETMQSVTAKSQEAKKLTSDRDFYELKLNRAMKEGKQDEYQTLLREYLDWETQQSKISKITAEMTGEICRGLFARALTGVFAFDDSIWTEYVRYLATSGTHAQSPQATLDVLRRAVDHCPWSGPLWSRYILSAEEARLPFSEIEQIKHKATSKPELYKDGMTALLDMYAAWCGFLKRTAMDINASDEAVDVADMGLRAALEFVDQAANRYGDSYRGDPAFRLERIYIQYLTEKKHCVDDARNEWHKLAEKQLYADSYDFWLHYYLWEMMIFASGGKDRSPTPSTVAVGLRVPTGATAVLGRAITRKTMDWPERVMEVYLQHCNDYELPSTVRNAIDNVHRTRKEVAKRREREAAEAARVYAAQVQQQAEAAEPAAAEESTTPGSKRKRESEADASNSLSNKRLKNEDSGADSAQGQQSLKRDRENTTVLVTNISSSITQTKIRQYFKDYGHINSMTVVPDSKDTHIVLLEFRTPEEARSALLRDGKYFGEDQIGVEPGTDLTIYVTNYPPEADQAFLRKLFKDCGEILSVRMPSLKGNTHRRFCYITFRDRAASAKATEMHGQMVGGRYKLTAMYSDPGHAKKREGAVEEGRELRITNLDVTATEDGIRDTFAKYGTVSRVNIPRNKAGKSHGIGYVEYETKEQALAAMSELNGVKLKSAVITVEVASRSNKRSSALSGDRNSASAASSPAPSRDGEGDDAMLETNGDGGKARPSRAEIVARTVALLGLPDTVNDVRVLKLVEPFGKVVDVHLQPANGGAKIEFADEAAAGRAALQLDGTELDGRRLRIGTIEELRHAKGEVRTDKIVYGTGAAKQGKNKSGGSSLMPPPTTVRRSVLGKGPKGGPKRGLGFVPKKADAAETGPKENGSSGEAAEAIKPKSNADFKAMFLGGEVKDGQNGDGKH